jgi:hypothetical protein
MPGAAPAAPKQGVFTRKLGPLPAWGWMSIAAAVVLVIVVYEYRKNAAGSSASTSSDSTTPPQVDQFQVTPPEQDSASGSTVPWAQNYTNLQADATEALKKQGVKNPTKAQIAKERKDIISGAHGIAHPAPKKKAAPAKRTPHAQARHK